MNGQPSSRALAVVVVVANLVVCGGVVAVLAAARDGSAPAAFIPATTAGEPPSRDGPAAQNEPAPRDEPDPHDEPPADQDPGPGAGFTEVTGPGGMTTRIPAGWPTTRASGEGSMQADDPAGTSTMLRYGGSATPATDTYDVHAAYERKFASGKQAFDSIRLERTVVRGRPAIDWEFEYDAAGERRHVRSVYWLADGHEYFVYASAPVPIWAPTRKILDVMLTYSTP